jgi:drug/metabolite transporter superfamily protein YnfA
MILVLYGVIPTFQPAHFGRVYATYGGFFIVLSLLWGWVVDGNKPDSLDLIGGVVSLVGETPIVGVLEIRHTADTPGLEPVAFHRIQSLRRGAAG